jgi:hypothetical protein
MSFLLAIQRTLHQLEGPHWPAKLFPVVYILYRKVKRRLHEPQVDCQVGYQSFTNTNMLPKRSTTENQSF